MNKKILLLIVFIFLILLFFCLFLPLFHDFLFDRFGVSNYEEKEGIISDVILKNDKDSKNCEYIIVDNYNIFIQCGKNYKQQYNIGDKTKYYLYKGKGYHTEAQMKSSSLVGKILDYGLLGTYILIFILLTFNRGRIINYVDEISKK